MVAVCQQLWTDKQLIDCWRATRDKNAFGILDDRHRPSITRYIRKCLKGRLKDLAEEIAQEVFTDLHTTDQDFQDGPAVAVWLVRVADRRIDDFLRRQSAKKRGADHKAVTFSTLLAEKQDGDGGVPNDVPHELLDLATPDQLACRNESAELIRKLIDRLADPEKAVLTKMWFEGHDMTSAAEALGISRAKAWRLVEQAKDKLRQMHEINDLL